MCFYILSHVDGHMIIANQKTHNIELLDTVNQYVDMVYVGRTTPNIYTQLTLNGWMYGKINYLIRRNNEAY